MKMNWMTRTCWMAALALSAAMALAQGPQRLDIYLKDADLPGALDMLTRQTGIQFVLADRDKEFGMITLSLKEATPEAAIEKICLAAGAYAERDASGVYVIRFGKPSEKPVEVDTPPAVQVPLTITKVRVRKTDALEVLRQVRGDFVFDPNQAMTTANSMAPFTRSGWSSPNINIVPTVNIPSHSPTGNPMEAVKSAGNPGDFNWNNDVARQLGGGGIPGGGAGGFGQGGGQPGGGAGGGQAGGQQGGTNLQAGTGLVPNGIESIQYDPTDNSLVVQGTEEAIRRLRQIIELFDVAPKQVEIKVEFITTSQSVSRSFGFEWQYARGAIFTGVRPGEFARSGDPIFINYSSGNLATRLRTQLLDGDGKVVTAPIVRTLNNQSASVFQQLNTTIFLPQTTVSNGTVLTTYTPQNLPIQTGLQVRPRIQDDGYIAMILFPTVSDLGQVRRGPDGTEVPDQLSQTLQVAVRVRDRDTIVLGGLNRTQTFSNTNRFPILGDLPIIGQFFRSTRSERNDQELLIFVTPRVIYDEEEEFIP